MQKPPKRINKKTGKLWTAKEWAKQCKKKRWAKYRQTWYKRELGAWSAKDEGEYEQFPVTAGEDRSLYNLGDGCKRILPHIPH